MKRFSHNNFKIIDIIASSDIFKIKDFHQFKKKAFAWAANAFDVCCCFDNNGYTEGLLFPEFECLIACGVQDEIILTNDKNAFEKLKEFQLQKQDWLFGFLSYDLKNSIENLTSHHSDGIKMPDLHFSNRTSSSKFLKIMAKLYAITALYSVPGIVPRRLLPKSIHLIFTKLLHT